MNEAARTICGGQVVKDPFHVASHLAGMHCPANDSKRKAISDDIRHARSASVRLEAMGVVPNPVGTGQLRVDEAKSRLPPPDLRLPTHRNAVPAQAVPDSGSGCNPDRTGRDNAKPHPRRRYRFQIPSVGEEVEHFLDWPRDPLLTAQRVEARQTSASRLLDSRAGRQGSWKRGRGL